MSVCIRAGVAYNRHKWVVGRCARCGAEQSKDIFSHELPGEPQASVSVEPLQTTEPQQDGWSKFYESHPDLEHDELPSDFQTEELDRP